MELVAVQLLVCPGSAARLRAAVAPTTVHLLPRNSWELPCPSALTDAAVRADVAGRAVARPRGNVTHTPVLAFAWPCAVVAVPPGGALCGGKE